MSDFDRNAPPPLPTLAVRAVPPPPAATAAATAASDPAPAPAVADLLAPSAPAQVTRDATYDFLAASMADAQQRAERERAFEPVLARLDQQHAREKRNVAKAFCWGLLTGAVAGGCVHFSRRA